MGMKYVLFMLVALLAALMLAAPPGSTRGDLRSFTTAYPTTRLAEPHNFANWTSLNGFTGGTLLSSGKYGVALRMGPDRQHVGTIRGQRLYDAIYGCLNWIHPWDEPDCRMGDARKCSNTPCRINGIVYNDNIHGTPKYVGGKAYLEVKMWWPYDMDKRNTKTPLYMRRLTYEIIASAYRKITEQPSNCYLVDFPGSRATKFCMVPKQFLVAYSTTSDSGNVQDVVKIDVKFNGKSEGGDWNCSGTVEDVNDDFLYRYRDRLAEYMSVDPHEINPQAMCAPDECLDWYKPNPDGPWQENPKCKLPDFKMHD